MKQLQVKPEYFLAFILTVAAALRFYNLSGMSLMNDELSMLARTHYSSFSDLINLGVKPDVHPAGMQVFIFYWIKFFGDDVWIIRLPIALAGILSVFMLYKTGVIWFNKNTALFAAAALAALQFPLLYSQLIRMYTPGLLSTLVFTYCWSRLFIIDNSISNKKLYSIIYVIAGAACLYLHYFALMTVGIIGITGIFIIGKSKLRNYIFLNAAILVLFIPHFQIFLSQLSQGGVGGQGGWLPKPDGDTFFIYFKSFFNDNMIYILVLSIMVASLFIFWKQISFTKFHLLSVLFYVLPFLIAYVYSVERNPVLQMPGMLFAFPFLLLFAFSFMPDVFNAKTYIPIISFSLLLAYNTVVQKKYYSTYHFGEFKQIADLSVNWQEKLGQENTVMVANVQHADYMNYYFNKLNHPLQFEMYKVADDSSCASFYKLASTANKPYMIYCFTNMSNPPQVRQVIQAFFPFSVFSKDMFNSGFYVYSKTPVTNSTLQDNWYKFIHEYNQPLFNNDTLYIRYDTLLDQANYCELTKFEYGPGFEKKLSDMNYRKGATLNLVTEFYSPVKITDSHLVLAIMKNDSSYVWLSSALKFWQKQQQWSEVFLSSDIPTWFDGSETVKAFIWHRDSSNLYTDNLKVTLTPSINYYAKGIQK